jgi:uncharacterized protein YndB with AHSA1/START domain
MNDVALKPDTQEIVVDEIFPHAPATVWKALTTGALIARWLGMTPTGFEPVVGVRFTYQTTPAGEWDGVIHCQVLEAVPNQRLAYSWKGGHEGNVGYGARLETIASFSLSAVEAGTRLRLVHSGFVLPRNESAFEKMGAGWKTVFRRLDAIATEEDAPKKPH